MPHWAKVGTAAAHDAPNAQFCAGASLARLDHILRSGAEVSRAGGRAADVSSAGKSGAQPLFAGALRDAEQLAG
ncbi:MAG: hypothetical protein WA156_01220, partial [Methylocystis silviterrae]